MGMVCAYNEGLVENCHSSGTIDSGIKDGTLVKLSERLNILANEV